MNAMEVVHDGWLTKSPPEKRIWKAKWRRRWFTLRHSGQLPGQFILEYYTDPSKRKLKGRIDLDQCEQVDSGLTFDARKFNQTYRFIFDIRTPKRTYYLVAESESDMIKWVDSICSVCGLKIHVEEYESLPQPQMSPNNNNNMYPESDCNTSTASDFNSNNNSTSVTDGIDSPSGQYIFISDCISGRPINEMPNQFNFDLSKDAVGSIPNEPPPPPPKSPLKSPNRLVSGEFYDYPRPLQPLKTSEGTSIDLDISAQLSPLQTPTTPTTSLPLFSESTGAEVCQNLPPKVNWNTYPNDGTISTDDVDADSACQDNIRNVSISMEKCGFQDAQSEAEFNNIVNAGLDPPPRPPKPANLGENRKYENASPVLGYSSGTMKSSNSHQRQSADDSFTEEIFPDCKVPPPSANSVISPDDLYDFPRPLHEGVVDFIATTPPLPNSGGNSSALKRPRRHAYSNAPAGFIENKPNVFNYDTSPTNSASSQSYLSMEAGKPVGQHGDLYTEMSVGDNHSTPSLTPTTPGAVYCNISSNFMTNMNMEDLPPIVNRNLKPKKFVDGETMKSDSDLLTLAPPPACRMKSNAKQNFREPMRNVSSPTLTSPTNHTFPHRLRGSDQSSEDDLSSICDSPRSSLIDSERKFLYPLKKSDSEIQYLDLDLEIESGQVMDVKSPKTPDKSASSTVYKTVDFIKTKAFNETRQNVETYRKKSQS